MNFSVLYHPDIGEDLRSIPWNVRERIRRAIEERLFTDPVRFGEHLKRSLHGYRKLRVGDYRVIYTVGGSTVTVWKIGHRRDVYRHMVRRTRSES